MYQAQPNQTANRPKEYKFLVRDTATGKINRYTAEQKEAEYHANRLNGIYYPEKAKPVVEVPEMFEGLL